ncbi:MAG: hypothetical protein ABI696_19230 [Rubrivivax sp.]
MTKRHTTLVLCTVVPSILASAAVGAEPAKLKCEEWHPRLGQNADKSFAIDVAAKTCAGQPCSMSDTEFKWQEQQGRYMTTINRQSGEGTLIYLGELLFSYKNCALATSGN